jgi:hypothetical protein
VAGRPRVRYSAAWLLVRMRVWLVAVADGREPHQGNHRLAADPIRLAAGTAVVARRGASSNARRPRFLGFAGVARKP